MTKRIKWIDVLRCFGIFFIYLTHGYGGINVIGNTYRYMFLFHVPLFFFVGGFTESLKKPGSIQQTVKKVFSEILLPWFLFAILAVIVRVIKDNLALSNVFSYGKSILMGTVRLKFFSSSLWFLTCFALVRIIFAILRRFCNKWLILLFSFGLYLLYKHMLSPLVLPYNITSACRYLIFYTMGFILFPWIDKVLNTKIVCGKIILAASFLVCLILSGLYFVGTDVFGIIYHLPFGSIWYELITFFITIWVYIILSKLCENITVLGIIGSSTLYLCGSEYLIKVFLNEILLMVGLTPSFPSPLSIYFYSVITIVLAVYLMVPIEKKVLDSIRKLPNYILSRE